MDFGKLESSGIVLLASNLLALVLALVLNYNFAAVIWVYFLESIVIGIFTAATFFLASTRAAERSLAMEYVFAGMLFTFQFGFFHLFYAVFLVMFTVMDLLDAVAPFSMLALDISQVPYILLTAGILFLSHAFSFNRNVVALPPDKRIISKVAPEFAAQAQSQVFPKDLWEVMIRVRSLLEQVGGPAFQRILPLHMAIILSSFASFLLFAYPGYPVKAGLLAFFMLLKTYADLKAHQKKHGLD